MSSLPPISSGSLTESYTLAHRGPDGSFVVRGPYRCVRSPISGTVAVTMQSGDQATVDERLYMPLDAAPASGDIVRNLTIGQALEVLYVQRWPRHVEVFVRRSQTESGS